MPVRQHLEREPVQGPVQESQIQDWSKTTTFLGYDEVRAVKTPASSRLEGPARLHPLPGGQQSPRARQERSELSPMVSRTPLNLGGRLAN